MYCSELRNRDEKDRERSGKVPNHFYFYIFIRERESSARKTKSVVRDIGNMSITVGNRNLKVEIINYVTPSNVKLNKKNITLLQKRSVATLYFFPGTGQKVTRFYKWSGVL